MALRAVVFDYGMVLSGPPDPAAQAELRRITGFSQEGLESFYWIDRHAYDRGDLSGIGFWQKLVTDADLALSGEEIALLNHHDARMWTTVNPAMLSWHRQLKINGLQTGILSNMGDSVLHSIESSFPWINDFDVLIWSYQHSMAKPERAIYELLLERLGTSPEETLFLDDKLENIEAARQIGILSLQFSTIEQLCQDLISCGLDRDMPLPM